MRMDNRLGEQLGCRGVKQWMSQSGAHRQFRQKIHQLTLCREILQTDFLHQHTSARAYSSITASQDGLAAPRLAAGLSLACGAGRDWPRNQKAELSLPTSHTGCFLHQQRKPENLS